MMVTYPPVQGVQYTRMHLMFPCYTHLENEGITVKILLERLTGPPEALSVLFSGHNSTSLFYPYTKVWLLHYGKSGNR